MKKKHTHRASGDRHHAIRSTCKYCNTGEENRNIHRFHGYGSFARTHHSYCEDQRIKKKCCGAQNDPTCYIVGQKKKRKSKKR